MSAPYTCEARAKALWGSHDMSAAEEAGWWRRLVELVATRGFFVAGEKFPETMAEYARRRAVHRAKASNDAFELLLNHCDAWCRKLKPRKLDGAQKNEELEVKRSFHTQLKVFFRVLRDLMAGWSDDHGSRRPAAFARVFAAVLRDLKLPLATIDPLTARVAQGPLTYPATPASVGHRPDVPPSYDPHLHRKTSAPPLTSGILASKPSLGGTSVLPLRAAGPFSLADQLHLLQPKAPSLSTSSPRAQSEERPRKSALVEARGPPVIKQVRFDLHPEPRHTRGLQNLRGISCFMNATLQLLYDLEDFRNGVMESNLIPPCAHHTISSSRLPGILAGLRSIFGAMGSSKGVNIRNINGFDALASLKPATPTISCEEQEDAQTFLSNLATPIVECLPSLSASFEVKSAELRFSVLTEQEVTRDASFDTRAPFLVVLSGDRSMQARVVDAISDVSSTREVHKFAGIDTSKYLIIVTTQRTPLTDFEKLRIDTKTYDILGVISHQTGSKDLQYENPEGGFQSSGAPSGHYVYTRRNSLGSWAEYNDDSLTTGVSEPRGGYIFLYSQVALGP